MSGEGRRRRDAKQARRDADRRRAREQASAATEGDEETPLLGEVREALDAGHPLPLLGFAGVLILGTTPQPLQKPEEQPPSIGDLVAAFCDVRTEESTALLAALGELLIDDDEVRAACRRAVAARDDTLPRWLTALSDVQVYRAVRMTHVVGDGDELVLGVRFADGHEMTCAASIDHLNGSAIGDAFFVPDSIETVLDVARANNTDPDTTFADVDLADARAALQQSLDQPVITATGSETWPASRALVRWMTRLMPAGGTDFLVRQWTVARTAEFCDRFLRSPAGMPFDDPQHRGALLRCAQAGTGDPSRWSEARLTRLLDSTLSADDTVPAQVRLDVPDMLRAFVPFAHAESGIRDELTAEALAAIDGSAEQYRDSVLNRPR